MFNKNYKFGFKFANLKKFKKFKNIVLIGMGGSILGTEAIFNFLKQKIKKKLYFIDDINNQFLDNFKKNCQVNETLFLNISKSGHTTETLSNLFHLKIIKKNENNIIFISEKKNNALYLIAKKFNLTFFEHPSYIGGRYSVLSETGIIPSYLMGLDCKNLRKDIKKGISKEKKFLEESSIFLANLLKKKKYNNMIFLNYSKELEKFLFWCQQLIAESLGKNGIGFLPMISNVPKDHHSLLQLYLDGPKDKIFHIFSIEDTAGRAVNLKNVDTRYSYLNKKTLPQIKNAQKKALIETLKKKNIPFREFKIKKVSEQTLGQLFTYFIFEIVIIARIANINPFNQPAVEQVKVKTKKILI